MSTAYLMSASYFIDLAASDTYGLPYGAQSLGVPERNRVWSTPWKRGFSPLAGSTTYNRMAELTVHVRGTSMDDWRTNYLQIARWCELVSRYGESQGAEGEHGTLALQLTGQTNTQVFDVLAAEVDASRFAEPSMVVNPAAPVLANVPLRLWLKPFTRPQALVSATSGTLNNGGGVGNTNASYTLSPQGDVDAPLRLTFQSAAGDPYRRLLLARRSRGNVSNFIFAMNAENGTYTGYTVSGGGATTVVAGAHNGNVSQVPGPSFNQTFLWTLTKNIADFYGRYRVLLRIDSITGGPITSIDLIHRYGGASGDAITNPTVSLGTSTMTDRIVDVGPMTVPLRAVGAGETADSFLFSIRVSGTGDSSVVISLDCIYLVPVDDQVLDLEFSAQLSAQDQTVVDGLQLRPYVTVLDSSGIVQPEAITQRARSALSVPAPREGLWLPLWFRDATVTAGHYYNHDLTDQATLGFRYWPLSELWR